MPRMSVYITDALMTADFREMSSDEFKERYLAPLDTTIRESSIKIQLLLDEYAYPLGDACHAESAIQEYFNWRIAPTICDVHRNICGRDYYFGQPSIIRPPLDRRSVIKADITHMLKKGPFRNLDTPEICLR
ncbi:unnamed protein product [Debaryomyces tyrocola]|nr:unnamed protein product [Debaryomyces tyrocola]